MRKALYLLSLILLAACSEKGSSEKSNSGNILNNLTFTVDTVVVDPGEEIIDLSNHLRLADISEDRKKLFLFTESDNQLSVINLDQLTLQQKIPYEKEGPNGVGGFLWNLDLISDEKFYLMSFNTASIFDFKGIKLETINLEEEDILGIKDKTLQNNRLKVTKDLSWYYTVPGSDFDKEDQPVELAIINRESKEGRLFPLPALDKTQAYKVILSDGSMMQVYAEDFFLAEYFEKFYLTSSVTSEIYQIDPKNDSVVLHSYELIQTPKEKTDAPSRNEFSEREVWRDEITKIHSQITFGELLWDEQKDYFFRFGGVLIPSGVEGVPSKSTIYLMVFDKELDLLGETELEDLDELPEFPFFKDGQLWSYVNVEDELGFSVITFDF
ncbi:DUF4221 family protein [Algoriphagus halophilus]|uniref:DUF4221 domain-containing protein n=1 Tax=Algoriphagus halophilus TaxID=226505 RepID=A0A1N6GFE1_9BACT|nr:DUF4221 family protein [Algoriphagus halophilus]SIO06201.1 protein of unknown function [Algoriphagus halophilus]